MDTSVLSTRREQNSATTALPPPNLAVILVRVITSITVACVLPATLFSLTVLVFSVSAGIAVGLGFTACVIAWRVVTRRPMSWLVLLTGTVMTVRAGFTIATGNTFVYFIQPVIADAVVATIFLVSLCTAQPLVARLAPDFYPMDEAFANRPRIRRLLWHLTFMWGVVIVAKGLVTFWLLQTLPVVDFVLIKNASVISVTVLAAAASIWLSATVVGRERALAAR